MAAGGQVDARVVVVHHLVQAHAHAANVADHIREAAKTDLRVVVDAQPGIRFNGPDQQPRRRSRTPR